MYRVCIYTAFIGKYRGIVKYVLVLIREIVHSSTTGVHKIYFSVRNGRMWYGKSNVLFTQTMDHTLRINHTMKLTVFAIAMFMVIQ